MKEVKEVSLTIPQLVFDLAKQPKKFLEGGRGLGKSTLIGKRIRDIVNFLPRSSNALVGSTYSQILSRTLPSTVEGLEMFGLYQDVDFVVGRCGKKMGYEMPYQPPSGPMGWNNIIHFSNGTIFQLVSLDNPNSGRGLNSSTITADEAALLDNEKLYINVKATNRVSKAAIYKNHYLIGSEAYFSSTPLNKKGKWFTDMEAKAKANPTKYFFLKASSLSNPYLRKEWFEEMREECPSELIYNAEILNIRPKEITDGFYANLIPEKHYYSDYNNTYLETIGVTAKKEHFNCNQDNDIEVHRPLIVSLDFGVFNCCVVSQLQDNNYRVLKSFHVKSPKLLDDLFIEQFIPYYQPHQEKIIHLYGGHDGNNRLPNSSKTLFQQVEDLLRNHGWKVYLMTKGAAATHYDKYLLLNAMLKGHVSLPKIMINESNNEDLIISLEHAEAREGTTGVEKNKSSERNSSILQQHATHYSDAFDIPIVTMFNDKFKGKTSFASEFKIQ
jgi:hypothetical protein